LPRRTLVSKKNKNQQKQKKEKFQGIHRVKEFQQWVKKKHQFHNCDAAILAGAI